MENTEVLRTFRVTIDITMKHPKHDYLPSTRKIPHTIAQRLQKASEDQIVDAMKSITLIKEKDIQYGG